MSNLTIQLMAQTNEDNKNKPISPFEKMKHCPFCHSQNLTIRDDDGIYWGHCMNCLTDGPTRPDRKNAMRKWNMRVSNGY